MTATTQREETMSTATDQHRAAVAGRLSAVHARIDEVASASGRDPGDITLLAVSKTWPVEVIDAAVAAGQHRFGENRARELRDKAAARPDLIWHFVGRLQTNKVKYVVGSCALVHSLDRWDLARALADRAAHDEVVQDVLVQVNVDGDPAKAGVAPGELPVFLDGVEELERLRVTGLMTMPRRGGPPDAAFGLLRQLRDTLVADHPDLVELSMGMSADFEAAIRHGATILRLGEAVFGPRDAPT